MRAIRSMTERVPQENYPWWVKLTLLGSRTRRSQWFWIGFELVIGAVLLALAFDDTGAGRALYVIAAIWAFVLAWMSFATIRWIDRNGEWNR